MGTTGDWRVRQIKHHEKGSTVNLKVCEETSVEITYVNYCPWIANC